MAKCLADLLVLDVKLVITTLLNFFTSSNSSFTNHFLVCLIYRTMQSYSFFLHEFKWLHISLQEDNQIYLPVPYYWFYMYMKVLVLPLCPILCSPVNCSPAGSSVHGDLQARIPVWAVIPFSRASSLTQGSNPGLQADSLPAELPGKPWASCYNHCIIIPVAKLFPIVSE